MPSLSHSSTNSHCHRSVLLTCLLLILCPYPCRAEEWTRFRGPNGTGVSAKSQLPVRWSESENIAWKVDLPGAGSSSPIVAGNRIFVTCYSGYGMPAGMASASGSSNNASGLLRHLVCVDRESGKILWDQTIRNESKEDPYQGYISEHGYASGSPVTDGEMVYAFYGKSGVVAYDLNGQLKWQKEVGKESSNRRWGSGASLILYGESLIVNASEESQAIIALNKKSGESLWRAEASSLSLAYGTPLIVRSKEGRSDLVVAVPDEVWGMNPETGKIHWYARHSLSGNICPSIIAQDDVAYVFGGYRSVGSLAVRAGGKGDVTQSQLLWSSRNTSYVATPVLVDGHFYWINDAGMAFCTRAADGELVYRERVDGIGGGRPVYASPVVAGNKIYVASRWKGVVVLPAEPKYQVLAINRIASDESDFNATPAIAGNELFLRSNRRLYCIRQLP